MDDSSGDASSPAAGSSHRYPDWVMLDRHTRLNYPRPTLDYAEEHFRATHAYAETSKGDPVRVSFRAVPPPGTSRVYVRWPRPPERGEEDRWDRSYGGEPMILAAHGNSLLLQITTLENNRSDFFVYTVDPIGQPPSLQRLPRCDHEFTMGDHYRGLEHMFDLEEIGLLCDATTREFAVADLIVVGINGVQGHDTPVEAGLCVYRSGRPEDGWTATRPRIRHENGQGRDLIFWETDAVVSFGDSLCYVDYLRGVLFMDVLSACPQLRYVRLPVNIPAGDSVDPETGLRGCPEASRSVCVTDGGATMKFVEVVSCTVFISGSHAPASSSFTINMWKLNQDSMTWGKEASMEDTELWSLQGYGGDLPRAAPEYPLVSMKEPEVVCFVLGARNWGADGDGTWVIVVDMLNKTLRSSSRYSSVYQNCFESDGNMASASLFTNLGFMACEFSKVDLGGSFHTYPDVGGPFDTIEQAEKAIDQYLQVRRVPKMCFEQAGVSRQEMGIRRCLFWPDGTMKKRTRSYIFQKGHEHVCRLVCAVVDQYNEDHKLVGDRAYELKDVTEHQSFHEEEEWYRHLNFTAKSKGVNGLDCWSDKQFFVELKNTKQEGMTHGEWVVSCFCMVETNDNGYCKGCPNDVKHPNNADAYVGGHVGPEKILEDPDAWSDSDEDETSRERRIRRMYDVPRKPFVYPACATPKPT